MNQDLIDNNYLVVDDFISERKARELYKLFTDDIKYNPDGFYHDPQCPLSFATYNYRRFLILLCEKIPFMSDIIGQPMLPTYCYSRLYKNGEVLKPHTDRPSCEVSVTLNLGGDADWDIWFTKPNGEAVSCNLKPGQAVVYLGMISKHWREAYTGNNYAQVFLHYVKSNGRNWQHYGDNVLRSHEESS